MDRLNLYLTGLTLFILLILLISLIKAKKEKKDSPGNMAGKEPLGWTDLPQNLARTQVVCLMSAGVGPRVQEKLSVYMQVSKQASDG